MQTVILECNEHTATLTLNNPKAHNAFNDQMIAQLIKALDQVKHNNKLRALILKAEGKHFCAGADLEWMKRMADLDHQENLADAQQLARLMARLNELPIPVITRIQGAAYGGAIGLIACSDIAIAAEDARFCLSEVKLGLAPATIAPYVIEAMGSRRCRHLFISAESFTAQQACDWGLIHKLASPEMLDQTLETVLAKLLQNSPQAMRASKRLIKDLALTSSEQVDQSLAMTSQLIADLRVSDEGQEGLNAFFEKRKPNWQID